MRGTALAVIPLLLLLVSVAAAAPVHPSSSPITITPVSPLPGQLVRSDTPNITVAFSDSGATVDPSSVLLYLDTTNVTGFDGFVVTPTRLTYAVPHILRLAEGNHTITVDASDSQGRHAQFSWGFSVNTAAPPSTAFTFSEVASLLLYTLIGVGAVGAGAGGYIVYLQRTRRFTFRKYFATHPVRREYLVLYLPGIIGFLFILFGLLFVASTPGLPVLAPEYVVMGGLYIALTAFAFDARRQKQRIRAFERAFAQLLFEMADAMRGGIDPAKAIVELSKSSGNVLKQPLRIAADGIRLGRPFDDVVSDMVRPMKSPLIARYAQLIGEAASVGGETSAVVYRAAKDLDDFLKIEVERSKQLLMPVAVLYIAFGVLAAVLFALLYIAPTLGNINISFIGSGSSPLPPTGGGSGSSGVAPVPRLDPTTLKLRFFDLLLIVSLGTGAIIGAFTEGKARYGLVHSLGLMAGTAIAFLVIFP